MIIPVRCFTCGKVIANKLNKYDELVAAKMPVEDIFKELAVQRICCKRMLTTNVNACDKVAQYTTLPAKVERTTSIDRCRIYKAI